MLSCREVTRLVSDGLERELPLRERMQLRLHVMMCRSCSAYRRQIRVLDRLFRGHGGEQTATPGENGTGLSAEAKERIKAAVREHQKRSE